MNLAQTASIFEASAPFTDTFAEGRKAAGESAQAKRINTAFGARGAYIATALENVAIHNFLLWAAVFAALVLLMNKGLKSLALIKETSAADNNDKLLKKHKGGLSVDFSAQAKTVLQETPADEILGSLIPN